MKSVRRSVAAAVVALLVTFGPFAASSAQASSAAAITVDGETALQKLERLEPRSRLFARHAVAVLVFPHIFKAGLVFGGESGNGVLLINGRPSAFYNLFGGSFGLQIGGEAFGYALFFMSQSGLANLRKSADFAVGTGPSIAIINKGAGAESDTKTITKDIYAFPFNEKGLMADLTLQGTKISRIHPQ
jgi:lipid-binding SYLF domain-containing protein